MVYVTCFDVFALIQFLKHGRYSSKVIKPDNNPDNNPDISYMTLSLAKIGHGTH